VSDLIGNGDFKTFVHAEKVPDLAALRSASELKRSQLLAAALSRTTNVRSPRPMSNPFRLPSTIIPTRYDLEIWPDLEGTTFEGSVLISVQVTERCSQIVLNAVDLDIQRVWVQPEGANSPNPIPATVLVNAELERITLELSQELSAGHAKINLRFTGTFNEQLVGFYQSRFGETEEQVLAVTQFESTHARRCFPCFDEPAFKAVFSITLTVPDHVLAVSNSAQIGREELDGSVARITFADTMAMSTYLVAFVIGPLQATEPRMVAGVNGPIPLRVIFPPGSAHLCDFALDVAEAGLKFFENYYGIAYPGDKVDLVAVPDFAFGAMENLGCITFREVLLLVDPNEATQPELQRVADVINHELAHMWFGDLVTMKWWNGIWLNEAFATFMEITATNALRPDWDVWTSFGLARAAAFDTDALQSTRPIEFEVISPAEAEAMFDILTYEKGASVVRMLEQYLGAEVFRSGIKNYLEQHAYGVTETSDLWDALERVSGEPVRRIMDSWIFRGGHPLITVESTDTGLRLSQERFSYASSQPGASRSEAELWPTPMVLSTRVGSAGPVREHRILLEQPLELDLGGSCEVVQANPGGNGFFRIGLSNSLRTALVTDSSSSSVELFVLLDDSWAGFLAGSVSLTEIEKLLRALCKIESDPAVWRRISGVLNELHRLQGLTEAKQSRQLVVQLCSPALNAVEQLLAEPQLLTLPDRERSEELRSVLFLLLGGIGGDEALRAQARELWKLDSVDTSLRSAAIEVLAASATANEHTQLIQAWRESATPQEELRFLNALVGTEDPEQFAQILNLALVEVRTQNAPYLLRRAISHPQLGQQAWEFVTNHWSEMCERFPSSSLPRMLEGIRAVTDRPHAQRISAFIDTTTIPSGQRVLQQHRERMWVSVVAAERLRS